MKSYRINRDEMLSEDSIKKAFLKPSRGKRTRADVAAALENIEEEIKKVHAMLETGQFQPRKHVPVKINEKNYLKERNIIKPDYCYEQVVHHVIVQSIMQDIKNGMYIYVLGSIPGRGAHSGAKVIKRWIKNDLQNTKYVYKMDIRHFFESVDHDILKNWLRLKFRDDFVLELLYIIIDAVDKGLPLGYYTSQWLANFLLQPLDHYIKEALHVKYMTRYMDDIVCFGRNKKELHRVHQAIDTYLGQELNLTIKGNWQVFRFEYHVEEYAITCNSLKELEALGNELSKYRIRHRIKQQKGKRKIFVKVASAKAKTKEFEYITNKYQASMEIVKETYGRPLDYMGFEFHRDYTVMRESIMLRTTHKAAQISKQERINPKDAQSLLSSMGLVKHTDTYGMYLERIKPLVDIKKLKRIVSKDQRRLNARNEKNKLDAGRGNAGKQTSGTGDIRSNSICSPEYNQSSKG